MESLCPVTLERHITQDEDWNVPVKTFNAPYYRPLWAMKQACLEAADPAHGSGNEDIFIRPIAEWYALRKNQKNTQAST